ncbi:aminoglycoside phosphotransferase family protein [Streptacidiphilus griseoplanus]|uniref:aminoglycoside phosphotransferase family protein n=1 Tax=Peterkaempfera griseoplana TaxID=66896 RepID=UPI0006E454B4|nr:aminoglycoside phosphotransferase family protein [Peterkaempfera griseoplana]
MTVDLFPPSLPVLTTLGGSDSGRDWLTALPALVEELRDLWSLRLGAPFLGGSCAWVAPAELPDGRRAVLKVSWPHPEAVGEAEALRLWDGHGAVRVLAHDAGRCALLLERCDPGTELRAAQQLGAEQRLLLGAEVLGRLWTADPALATGLEPLEAVAACWADTAEERMARLRPDFDPGLVAHGVRLLRELPASAVRRVVLHGDFNPGNVLLSGRGPWLAIDAKPMTGDPAYDPSPLLAQLDDPFAHPDPRRVLSRRLALLADALGEDARRLAAWALARQVESALWALDEGRTDVGSMDRAPLLAELAGL